MRDFGSEEKAIILKMMNEMYQNDFISNFIYDLFPEGNIVIDTQNRKMYIEFNFPSMDDLNANTQNCISIINRVMYRYSVLAHLVSYLEENSLIAFYQETDTTLENTYTISHVLPQQYKLTRNFNDGVLNYIISRNINKRLIVSQDLIYLTKHRFRSKEDNYNRKTLFGAYLAIIFSLVFGIIQTSYSIYHEKDIRVIELSERQFIGLLPINYDKMIYDLKNEITSELKVMSTNANKTIQIIMD